jgi:hypothetical protein
MRATQVSLHSCRRTFVFCTLGSLFGRTRTRNVNIFG